MQERRRQEREARRQGGVNRGGRIAEVAGGLGGKYRDAQDAADYENTDDDREGRHGGRGYSAYPQAASTHVYCTVGAEIFGICHRSPPPR